MVRLSQSGVRDRLDDLDPATLLGLVAAVYDARGWAVDRVDRVDGAVLATPPGDDEPQRLVPAAHPDAADADATSVTVVDAADLRELLQYAVDEGTRTTLCRRFFDCEPTALAAREPATELATEPTVDGPETSEPGDAATEPTANVSPPGVARAGDVERSTGGTGGRAPTDRDGKPADDGERSTLRLLAVGMAAALVVGGVVTAAGPGFESPLAGAADAAPSVSGSDEGGELPGNDTESDRPAVMDREGVPVAPDGHRVSGSGDPFPPGVDDRGVTDASTLADAHEAALSNRSYRLSITHREYVDGELRGVATERAVVAAPNHYRSRVGRLGTVTHESQAIAGGSTYANGTVGYVRTDGDVRVRTEVRPPVASPPADVAGIADRTERLVRWYLSVTDSRIAGYTAREGTTTYRITYAGDPWPASQNVTGWARVDEDGLVRELHREYTPAAAPTVRVEVTVRIRPGPVTVTRPSWVPSESETATASERRRPSGAGPTTTDRRTPRRRPNV